MGLLVSLDERRRARAARRHRRATFSFDLADPRTYLAAERVERLGSAVVWQPVSAATLRCVDPLEVEARAATLRLPLVWPQEPLAPVPRAQRAAGFAVEHGRGEAFVLAASRLAFCGGFDLDDPEVLAEAAAAASLPLDGCLAAAADDGRDAAMASAGRFLVTHGADAMPVLQVGRLLFAGEHRVPDAAAALRDPWAGQPAARARRD